VDSFIRLEESGQSPPPPPQQQQQQQQQHPRPSEKEINRELLDSTLKAANHSRSISYPRACRTAAAAAALVSTWPSRD
jgi:hypothetical protein